MRLRRSVAVAVVTGVVTSLAAAPVQADSSAARVKWGVCPEEIAVVSPTLQCATLPVPLDHRRPDGVTIDIAVSRIASAKPAERRGILLLNPGGPGASGLTMPADLVGLGLPSSVSERYDLIGMDPRGVGRSAPVSCGFTGELDYFSNVPPYAVDDAAVIARARTAKAAAEWCAANDTEGRLRHITTANTARDLDAIRAALGEEKASFFGASYGSALGAAYASMFPDTTDRVVIDSNLGDTHLDYAAQRRFGLGVEQTFPEFAAWAAARHGTYGLGRTPALVRKTYFRLAGRLDETPVGYVNGAAFRFTTFAALYGKVHYPALAQDWQSLLRAGDAAVTRSDDRAATPAEVLPWDNFLSAYLAVTCNDVNWPEDVNTYRHAVAKDRERYPMYGAASANVTPCAYWAHEPSEPPVRINDKGPRNVLIVQNLRDPGTPHRGGELIREKFAERSRLVSVDGSGHGVYVYGDNACALNVTTAYLVDGTMPKDTFCGRAARLEPGTAGFGANVEAAELRTLTAACRDAGGQGAAGSLRENLRRIDAVSRSRLSD
ncbi:alpha/beta hydrolase [Micromonospora sp. DH14]|uniref:alpha/beta hydrolase n=1 Tax=Micromonospora sp. DH14 TaxID=3040120 RepID=UPI002442B78F|nr:alpha/beta hydrolase [Micromonospora sp. DH14]MDG9674086.1 alpha/beta hydrolase [Micromonospora sp. DH14]